VVEGWVVVEMSNGGDEYRKKNRGMFNKQTFNQTFLPS
jgi:hypothetical protein